MWYAEASNSTTTIWVDLTLANVFSVDRVGNLDVAGEIEGASLDINGNADISGNLTTHGHVQASILYNTSDLRLLNKAGSNWLTFASRNTAATEAVYDLIWNWIYLC